MTKKMVLRFNVDSLAAEQADRILTELGMTMDDAVNLMLHQVCLQQGLPFDVRRPQPKSFSSMDNLLDTLPPAVHPIKQKSKKGGKITPSIIPTKPQ